MSPTLEVRRYDPGAEADWEALVAEAPMATMLHTRRFLGYHGDRFEDHSALLLDGDRLAGVLPAACHPADPGLVVSHPGATFGGLVHDGRLRGERMIEAMEALAAHYAGEGFTRLRYAAVPSIYQRRPSADDLYALFRLDAARVRCDLSCALELADPGPRSSRRRRGLAKARKSGVEVERGRHLIPELWPVIEENLSRRHGASPVHTVDEMLLLGELFPDQIDVVLARGGGEVMAGVLLFLSTRVAHAQYIASTEDGNDVNALDAVFARCIEDAQGAGVPIFDFGTSNRDEGRTLNAGLYEFKAQFGGGGAAHEVYELELSAATPKPPAP